MFNLLAHHAVKRPRLIAALALICAVAAGAFGAPAVGQLNAQNSFQDPSSPSARAQVTLERATGIESTPGVLALVDAGPQSPEVRSVAQTARGVGGVARVQLPLPGRPSSLVSRDGHQTLVAISLTAGADSGAVVDQLSARLPHDVLLGGGDVAGQQISSEASKDLGFAELIAFPLLTLISLLIFRGVAALLPMAVGGLSVLGTFVVLALINMQLSLSNFALNLVIGIGLGLAVDYSLLVVWRFREELAGGAEVEVALARTLNSAGRTVCFSAVTVAAAMLTLTVFPQRFLVSMGIGGAAVALLAAASSLLVLPALLVLLADRLARVAPPAQGTGFWYRMAHRVMRRPVLVAGVTVAALLLATWPTTSVRWTGIDASVLPQSQSARVVADRLSADFGAHGGNQAVLAIQAGVADRSALAAYAASLRHVTGVVSVSAPRQLGPGVAEIALALDGDPISGRSQRTLATIQSLDPPFGVQIDGQAAQFHDQHIAIADHAGFALILLTLVTLSILWLMTGSIVLPVKALVMNLLTAGTATGVLVLIFQHGRLAGLLDYTSQGGVEQTNFLVLAAVTFALSTDYGVLVLSRIKEAHDGGLDNREAIAVGIGRTGRIVSASALLMAVAIGAFATSQVIFLKEIGVGAAVAVLVDAFVVRCALVPSLMVLLGEANWWSPRPLVALHRLIGINEHPRVEPVNPVSL
jgi:uncharacterized membrane protein YdfJ with MMPL/SSD domain